MWHDTVDTAAFDRTARRGARWYGAVALASEDHASTPRRWRDGREGFTVSDDGAGHEESEITERPEMGATCSMMRICPSRHTGQTRREIPVRAS